MEAAKKGRFNAYAEDAFQFAIQIVYLVLLNKVDWATVPCMAMSFAGFAFRMFVSTDQRVQQRNHGELVSTISLRNPMTDDSSNAIPREL